MNPVPGQRFVWQGTWSCLLAQRESLRTMKVNLDDERTKPEIWTRVDWPDEAIELLETVQVTEFSARQSILRWRLT